MGHIKWTKLLLMAILSFITMYILMYMMVDTFGNIYLNLDQLYMTLAMTSVMVVIEVVIMGSMYSRKVKGVAIISAIIFFIISFLFVRYQTGISDREFLKSMISHHGSAILMCTKANIQDNEIQQLCTSILSSQQSQIDWMKTKLSNSEEISQYSNSTYGISFSYPDDYVLTEKELGDAHRYHHAIILIQKADATPRVDSDGPVAVTIDIYQNNIDKLSLIQWLKSTSVLNYKLSDGTYATTTVAGVEAIYLKWSGLYEAYNTAFLHKENLISIVGTYLTPEDRNIQVYKGVLASVKLF